MKKLSITILFSFCMVILVAGMARATTVLRLAENQPDDYPTTIGDKAFAEMVEKKTGGRIKIEVYAGGVLGDEKSVLEAIQLGGLDFARVNAQPLASFNKDMMLLSLPYLFRDEKHLWKVLNGPIGNKFLAGLNENKMVGLAYYDSGARCFYNTKRAVAVPADLKGMKIRVQQSELMMEFIRALGASPTPMPYSEVYTGLQSGVLDGAENNWPSYYSTSHHEVAKYYTVDRHSMTPEVVVVSKVVWDKLSPADQKIIREAAKASQKVQIKAWKDYEDEAIAAIRAKGNVVTEVKDFGAWEAAVKPIYGKLSERYRQLVKEIRETK